MKDLFKNWQNISPGIKRRKHLLLLSDFDGTLTKIVKHPKLVKVDKKTKSYLRLLSRSKDVSLGVVSGRPLKNIKNLIRIERIFYVGNHGFELEYLNTKGKTEIFIHPEVKRALPLLKKITKDLERELKGIKGLLIENKIFTLSLHYRMVKSKDVKKLKRQIINIIKPYKDCQKIKVTYGKKVIEIRPPINWNKGNAVLKIKDLLKKKDIVTIYLGDDRTDEDVFKILRKDDLSIYVGTKRKSYAAYRIKGAEGVLRFLQKVYELRVA